MVHIEQLSHGFGAQILFDNANLQINPGERIGLVGRNGHGKSTLLGMVLGELEPDSGSIHIPADYRIGHVAQHLHFTKDTLIDEACLGLREGAEHERYRVERTLFGLGFTKDDMDRAPSEFSGGYQVRLNLAKVLAAEPNLLLLDEPTNYLDIVSIRWFTQFLRQWQGELLLITHDRAFMDDVTTHTAAIHRHTIRKMPGSTDKLYTQIAQDETVYEQTRMNEERQRKHMEKFVERFRAKASKASAAQSRMKMLEKMPEREKLAHISSLAFTFNYDSIEAKRLLQAHSVQFGYDPDSPLMRELDMDIHHGDRIGIIGKNGRGKSTLLNLLGGHLQAQAGTIKSHPRMTMGYFGQTNIDRLQPDATIEEEVGSANPDLNRTAVRGICGAMMFTGDLAEKKISVLSGGERSRVLLGQIIATPANVLLLDEPTNHLDMESIESLIDAIDVFPGAIIFVTHSEDLLRRLATRLLVFQGGNASWFNDSYDEFLRKVGWNDEGPSNVELTKKESGTSKKERRQERAALMQARSEKLKPLTKEIATLEERITTNESQHETVMTDLAMAAQSQDAERIAELSKEAQSLKTQIDSDYERLDTCSTLHDTIAADFARQLASIE